MNCQVIVCHCARSAALPLLIADLVCAEMAMLMRTELTITNVPDQQQEVKARDVVGHLMG